MNKEVFDKYRGAMAYIEVKKPNGDIGIGSAFHVGDGVFVTAKHVVEGNKILEIATTENYYVPDKDGKVQIHGGSETYRSVDRTRLSIKSGPHYPTRNKVDVAAIVVNETDHTIIKLGGHLDDWINDPQFVLFKTIIMGYPPIPFSNGPILFAASAEINAVVDKRSIPHPHFIISAMPRGGFSGGVCLVGECALGVIVESLIYDNRDTELGFMSVLSVEPIFICLNEHDILPEIQKEGWDGLWDTDNDFSNLERDDKPFE